MEHRAGPTIELFEQHWNLDRQDKDEQAGYWDRRADAFNRHKEDSDSRQHREALMDDIMVRCRLTPQSRVLDIGCGTGHNALLLADRVAEVTAFDLSPRMIELARENARREGKEGRVHFQVLDWATADLARLGWEKRFDLTLASRTPAICDKATLVKMIEASRGFCLILTLAQQHSAMKTELKRLMDRDEERLRAGRSFYCSFNLLWLMGYLPEIRYLDHAWDSELSIEDAYLVNRRFLEQGGPLLTPEEETRLRSHLTRLAVNGQVPEKVSAKIALMSWPQG